MATANLLLEDFDLEIRNTRRTLERIPERTPAWTPHERSMPIGRLAMHCATLPLFGAYVLEDDAMDLARPLHPHTPLVFTSPEELLAQLDQSAVRCREALTATSDDRWTQPFPFTFGEHILSNDNRFLSFRRMCLNHLIHHRGQLTVYLRLLDIPVPALYGPSADEEWAPAS